MDEPAQRVNALTIGKVDYTVINSDDVEFVKSLEGYKIWPTMAGSAALAYFNCTEGTPLGTLEARKAICHAIDRETINQICYNGLSKLPRWANTEACLDFEERFIDPNDDIYSVGYDPELAKKEAEAAGLVGKKIRIMTNGTPNFILMAEIVEQNLKEIGLDAEIINYDQATYWGLLMDENNFEIALYMNGSPKNMCLDMYPAYLEFFGLGLKGNKKRDAFVELGNKGLATADAQERSDILNQLGRDFNAITAWFALAENLGLQAVSKDLGSIEKYNDGEVRYAHWYWVN
jgi:peptide/nickel transport system substrate-binding protein